MTPSRAWEALGFDPPIAKFRARHLTTRLLARPLSPGANKPPQHIAQDTNKPPQHISQGTNKPPQHVFLEPINKPSHPMASFWSE